MLSDIPTVEQLVLGRLGQRTIDVLRRTDPEAVENLVAALMRDRQLPSVGVPEEFARLVDFAKSQATEDVEAHFDAMDAYAAAAAARKVGRPRASPIRDMVLMTAFYTFTRRGIGPTIARRNAAKLLGIKADAVEKGVRRFLRRMLVIERLHGLTLEEIARVDARLMVAIRLLIEECAEERRLMLARPRTRLN